MQCEITPPTGRWTHHSAFVVVISFETLDSPAKQWRKPGTHPTGRSNAMGDVRSALVSLRMLLRHHRGTRRVVDPRPQARDLERAEGVDPLTSGGNKDQLTDERTLNI